AGPAPSSVELGELMRRKLTALIEQAEDGRELAALALALRRLPEWALETQAERDARLAAENAAIVEKARGGNSQPGARARLNAGSYSRGGVALFGKEEMDPHAEGMSAA